PSYGTLASYVAGPPPPRPPPNWAQPISGAPSSTTPAQAALMSVLTRRCMARRGELLGELIARLDRVGRVQRDDRAPLTQRRPVIARARRQLRQLRVQVDVVRRDPDQALEGHAHAGG